MNTLISFLWWIIGFYWVVSGGEVLEFGAPRLYWYVTFVLIASQILQLHHAISLVDFTKVQMKMSY